MNIAIFGGSFDPPHVGHQIALQYYLNKRKFDEIWVIPSPKNPLKGKQSSFSDRIKMCHLAFNQLSPSVKILEEEKVLSGYTIDLIQHLKKKYPNYHFTFLGGSDLEKEINQWKDPAELKKQINFEFFPRPPDQISPFPNISSSEIREKVKKHLPIDKFVPNAVEDYIDKHQLYPPS